MSCPINISLPVFSGNGRSPNDCFIIQNFRWVIQHLTLSGCLELKTINVEATIAPHIPLLELTESFFLDTS